MEIFIILLLFDAMLAVLFGLLADYKGYNGYAWGIIGFLFPVIYIWALLMPNLNKFNNVNNCSVENAVCGSCNKEVPNDAKICPYCGVEFEIVNNNKDSICGNCDRKIPSDARICPYCGVEFENVDDDVNTVCGNCDKEIPNDAKVCPYCGVEFETQKDNKKENYSSILPYH